MKTIIVGLAAGMLVFAAVGLRAEMASGSYTNSFTNDVKVWDVSGTYTEDLDGIILNYTLNMDPSGKFTGQGSATVSNYSGYDMQLNINMTINGRVTTAGQATRFTMALKLKGAGTIEGYDVTFRASVNESAEVEPTTRQIIGRMNGVVSVSIPALHRGGSQPVRTTVEYSLPDEATGNWDLTINVSPNGKSYIGSAMATLAGTRTVKLTAKGNYVAKSDTTKLTLKGPNPVSLAVTACCTNGQMNLKRLTGKLMGQRVNLISR